MTTRRRILCVCIALLIVCSMWISALAAGRYAASRESNVYHRAECHYVDNINRGNLIWFASIRQAEAAGYRACSRCHPDWLDWEYSPDSGKDSGSSGNRNESGTPTSKDTKPATPSPKPSDDEPKQDATGIIAGCIYAGGFLLLLCEFFGTGKRKPKNTQKHQASAQATKQNKKQNKPSPDITTSVALENKEKFQSSFIADAAYSNGTLYLTFTSGGRYAYQNVPKSVYDELLEAPSKGRFFHAKINGYYPYYIPK